MAYQNPSKSNRGNRNHAPSRPSRGFPTMKDKLRTGSGAGNPNALAKTKSRFGFLRKV